MQIEEIMTKNVGFCRTDDTLNVAASAMSRELHAGRPSDPIDVARRQLGTHQIRRLAIVGADGRLAGILSLGDLARAALALRGEKPNGFGADAIETALVAICRPRADTRVERRAP